MVPLSELNPAPYNPRDATDAQLRSIARSLVEFGIVDPFVARAEDKLIIGGHQRYKAICGLLDGSIVIKREGKPVKLQLPDNKVPVVFVAGLSEQRTKMLNLALNKATGDWSYDRLTDLIADLSTDIPVDELTITGFTQAELADLIDLKDEPFGKGTTPATTTRAPNLTLDFSSAKLRDAVKSMLAAETENRAPKNGKKPMLTGDVLAALLNVKAR